MRLYRAVCDAERDQIIRTSRLQTVPSSLEGKWFAERIEDARRWGERFAAISGVSHATIVVFSLADELADGLFRVANLDNIGPARVVDEEDLAAIRIEETTC